MATDYWIKLYNEILNDPKMALLPDRIWRRTIELFLVASQVGGNERTGELPSTEQIAWYLRMPPEELEPDLIQIAASGIIKQILGGWLVVNFQKRQSALTGAERMKMSRERQHKQEYYGDETQHNGVTVSNTELKIEIDKEEEKEKKSDVSSLLPLPLSLPTKSTSKSIPAILSRAAGLSAIPPDELRRVEQITCLIEAHGNERVESALKVSAEKWRSTNNKNGKPYPITNMGWVDWAQAELDAGQTSKDVTLAVWDAMTDEQRYEYVGAGGNIPYE